MRHIALQVVNGVRTLVASLMLVYVGLSFETSFVLAQVTTTIAPTTGVGNLGTTATTVGTTVQITGGTRPGSGTNLFHSFDQFNVGAPDTAQFLNTTPSLPTSNILGRVTGGNPSSIFGTIDTMSYPGANLFLMNPAGIVFGPNATLNVGGSVAFTTADYLRLTDAGIFHAEPIATSVLTTAPVGAFGFLGTTSAAIAVQGSSLAVQPGQSISLVGGDHGFTYTNQGTDTIASAPNGVTMTEGRLLAPGGQVHITSVASPGEILTGTLDQIANINGQSFGALGTVQISQQSAIETSGEGGGTILIRGGRLVVDDSTISANTVGVDTGLHVIPVGAGIDIHVSQGAVIDNGAVIETNAIGPVAPDRGSGGVRIIADHIVVSGGPKILAIQETNPAAFTGIRSNVEPGSTAARSGDISLDATSILIKDLGQIETQTASAGNAGNITLTSSQGNMIFTNALVTSQAFDSIGNAGKIAIIAPHGDIVLGDSTGVFTLVSNNTNLPTGTAGDIQIIAHNLHLLDTSAIGGIKDSPKVGGNIVITLDGRLTLAGGSFIETSAFGPGFVADLTIKASDILIAGEKSVLSTGTTNSGAGGRLRLFTDNLRLADGGSLSSTSSIGSGSGGVVSIQGLTSPGTSVTIDGPGSGIFSDTSSTGRGGGINLSARSLIIQNGGMLSAGTSGTAPSATGGLIMVQATDHVTMTGGASITVSSTGPANAGNISVNAGQQFNMRDSSITAKTELASGGNIDIQAVDLVHLVNSSINTSVFGGAGNGGNITIDPNVVVLQGSQVKAEAFRGVGGDITITTPLFLADSTSQVSALSPFGLNGTVTIQNPTSNLSGSLATLPLGLSRAHILLMQRCAARSSGQTSTFVVAGREQLPADPGGWLSSPLAFTALGESLDAGPAVASAPALMSIAADDTSTVSLRRLTPAGFLMANFAESAATGCHS